MNIEVELKVESNYPELFTGAFVTIMADDMANSTTELTYDNQIVSFDVPKVNYDGDNIIYSLGKDDVSVNGELFYVYSVEETVNYNGNPKFIVTVKDSYVDAYVQVIYDDGFQQYTDNFYKRPTLSADMNAMLANGNNAPATTVQQVYTDSAVTTTSRVQIANDLLPGTYGLDEFDYSGLANGYYQKNLTVETLENGDILYTIVLDVEVYDVRYYDTNGNELTIYEWADCAKLDQLAGTTLNLASYQWDGYKNLAYGYKYVWLDPVTNKTYDTGASFTYPEADTDLYLTVVKDTNETPRIYFNIISYNNSHYIPGYKVAQRMDYDETTNDFVFVNTSYDEIKNDREGKYFMISMVLGVDDENVSKTRFEISTESLVSKEYIYYEELAHDAGTNLVTGFRMFGKHSNELTGSALIGEDYFLNTYDGYRQVRMVLPAEEFEKANLYINAYYYDDSNNEYLHGDYVLDIDNNGGLFWTLTK
ncbi:MAG: hypothetical protein IJ305_09070, partial [Oscillospiraceae bacterium]|nr:hypothetical protein [Oscillospiraceae bacterium]